MKIYQEIEALEVTLDNYDDTHPDYLPDYLKSLRNRIFACHQRIFSAMSAIVITKQRNELKSSYQEINDVALIEVSSRTIQLLEMMSYLDLLRYIIREYSGVPKDFKRKIEKVNTIRNRFAHVSGVTLRQEYDWSDKKGKVKYRDVLRALVEAENYVQREFRRITA